MARRPFDGAVVITQEYGVKSTLYRKGYHTGVDYGLAAWTALRAPASGRIESGNDGGYYTGSRGKYIILYGADGFSHALYHLADIVVGIGTVAEGQLIGYSGNTGQSDGPHLHWEVRKSPYDGNSDIHPGSWLFAGGSNVAPAPLPATKFVYLPPVPAWRLYNERGPYTIGSEKALLRPINYGGLTYEILATPAKDMVVIQTSNFGRGAIYVGAGTNAVIR